MPLSEEQKARARKIRAEMQAAAPVVAANADDATLLSTFTLFDAWSAGVEYKAKDVVRHEELLYQVGQDHTSQAHQPPGIDGMLAIYRPVQGEPEPGTVLPWVSGEAVKIGDKRVYEGVAYEVYAEAGTNIWPPPDFPAAWRVAEE
ncbi:hypothetical protein LJC74_03675 [Eubacteriales bacterium OttesenSCG-928-A19]|nr:hypothetical protein [Eubacteriales bacterium OttesenSCG-928-A19]